MLLAFESHVKATIAFLRRLHVKVNASTVNETLQNHPDETSLLSISDALGRWSLPNGAGKIEPADIGQLPVPFIALTRREGAPFIVVTEVDDKYVHFLDSNYRKKVTNTRSDFIKVQGWIGMYLIAEPGMHSGEPDYKAAKRKETVATLVSGASILVMAFLATLLFWTNIKNDVGENSFPVRGLFLQYFITLAGVFITSLLLWYETDRNNPLLKKVCTGIAKGNCAAILTGKAAKAFHWLSWSEVGFFYFTGALLCMILPGENMLPYISLIALLNLLALPYPVFSVYYQWRVAKQWCVLCLIVQVLLVSGAVNVLVNQLYGSWPAIGLPVLAQGLLLYAVPVLCWFSIKPFVLKVQRSKNEKREYLRIKFNDEIFETLLRTQPTVTVPDGLGIDLGAATAKHLLIKVCNPYCGPCSKAHPQMEKLLEEMPDLKAKIIFTGFSGDEAMTKPAMHLMAIAETSDEGTIKKALDDWYLPAKKDYEAFAGKYPVNGQLQKQDKKIKAMYQWCTDMKVTATPTFFINGYQLPRTYDVADLRYFLLE
jgi:uncharacterized membrane protein